MLQLPGIEHVELNIVLEGKVVTPNVWYIGHNNCLL